MPPQKRQERLNKISARKRYTVRYSAPVLSYTSQHLNTCKYHMAGKICEKFSPHCVVLTRDNRLVMENFDVDACVRGYMYHHYKKCLECHRRSVTICLRGWKYNQSLYSKLRCAVTLRHKI